eukprot:EG_transcript_9317
MTFSSQTQDPLLGAQPMAWRAGPVACAGVLAVVLAWGTLGAGAALPATAAWVSGNAALPAHAQSVPHRSRQPTALQPAVLSQPLSMDRSSPSSDTPPAAHPTAAAHGPAPGPTPEGSAAEGVADALDAPAEPLDASTALVLLGATVALLVGTGPRFAQLRAGRRLETQWSMASLDASADASADAQESNQTSGLSTIWGKLQRVVSFLIPDLLLLAYLAVWYYGNYMSNISNKLALAEMGGSSGCPLLIGSAEMLVGALYALFLWAAPDARPLPRVTRDDFKALVPLTICTLGHQFSTVFATSAGSLSSVQILKATEPVFAALFASFIYGTTVSRAKWLSLIPIIGGVALASLKEVSFSWVACAAVLASNVFSAMRSNESRKAMQTPGLKDRLGSVGNQFAVTTILCFLLGLPLSLIKEWHMLPTLGRELAGNPAVLAHIVSAGWWFYIYNEVSTLVVKRTGALTQSVLNTAKRVIVIFGAAIVLGEGLAPMKLLGCTIGILGVFLYSVVDKLKRKTDPPAAAV